MLGKGFAMVMSTRGPGDWSEGESDDDQDVIIGSDVDYDDDSD